MNRFIKWLKSSSSDFLLFVIFLVLANLVCSRAFFRLDMTSSKSYTLSKGSKEVVKNLEQPLSIRVFFDDNLPAPYSSVSQYVKDILVEYKGAGNKNFSISYMDMSKPENVSLARSIGLNQIQIQEVKNNEVGFKQGYMGLAITYGDSIETLDPITSTDELEFKITSKITKMINTADTLAGLSSGKKITLTLYYNDVFTKLGIQGADKAEKIIRDAFDKINAQNQNRMEFVVKKPDTPEVEALVEKYGIEGISYKDPQRKSVEKAALGLVLEYDEGFYALPLNIQNMLFTYVLSGLDDVETSIIDGLQMLLLNVKQIGYVTGHGERSVTDRQQSMYFKNVIPESYEFIELDLSKDEIPGGMKSIIINGPKNDFTEEELYKIDQFVMKGGNVMLFVDSMQEGQADPYYGVTSFAPNEVNIERLLNAWGVKTGKGFVMDKNCYVQNDRQYGKLNLYWIPVLQKNQLEKNSVLTKNLGYVYMPQSASLEIDAAKDNKSIKTIVLANSSDEAWTMEENVVLNPLMIAPPADKTKFASYPLAVLLEGKFKSAFEASPVKAGENEKQKSELTMENHILNGVSSGKIFVAGTSIITTGMVIDENGESPVALFLMNVIDYMNGNEELCEMRTKGLSVNTLTIKSAGAAIFWRFFNQYMLAGLVGLAGLLVLNARINRKRKINRKYNPDDQRTISK